MRSLFVLLLLCLLAVTVTASYHSDVNELMAFDDTDYVLAEEVASLENMHQVETEVETETQAAYPLTADLLQRATGMSAAQANTWLTPIKNAAAAYDISTARRMAHFLAQCSAESGRFSSFNENLNYSAAGLVATWPSRFTKKTAPAYARNPQKIANYVYAGRLGNGNAASGDGWKYRGRGLIQLTGKSGYANFGKAVGQNFLANPDLLLQPNWAALSAAWFWKNNGLNALADKGISATTQIGATINGKSPPHGAATRTRNTNLAFSVLK